MASVSNRRGLLLFCVAKIVFFFELQTENIIFMEKFP